MERNIKGDVEEKFLDYETILYERRTYRMVSRFRDIVLSAVALIFLTPAMIVVAVMIVIDSPGASPIFSQTRVGRNGRLFKIYKFRSMYPNAERELNGLMQFNEMDGPVFKIKNDPRITRMGRFIRKTSIDELPQLYNIFRGDMSFVGPRPALLSEVEKYDMYTKQRLYVEQGLTCYWQIQPHRNDLRFEEWMKLDIQYIEEQSLWLDWKIMFKTVQAVVKMSGE